MVVPRRTRHLTFRLLCMLLSTSISSTTSETGNVALRIAETTEGTDSGNKIDLQVFENSPRSITLAPSRRYEIECSYSASFAEEDSWKKNGLMADLTAGVSVMKDTHQRTLVFDNVTSEHAGFYQCVFPGGMRELNVKIGNPTIILEFVDLVFTAGDVINDFGIHDPLISGDYPQTAELQWYKDDVQQTLTAGFLFLGTSANEALGGTYTAKLVENNAVLVSEMMNITIYFLPYAELTTESSQVLVGEPLKLICQDNTGFPISTVQWSKDEMIIDDDTVIEGIILNTISTNHSELIISNSQLSHNGTYGCTASNNAGTHVDKKEIEILLHPPSTPVLAMSGPASPSGYWAGSELTLTCSVTVSSGEHHANIVWKKGGVVIASNERISIVTANESATVYTSQVTFSGVSAMSDSGDYVCEGTARMGAYYSLPVSSGAVTITVQVPTLNVSVTAKPDQVLDTEPHNQVVLYCSATVAPSNLLPDVIYEWFVDGKELEHNQNGLTASTPGSLVIYANEAGNFVYTCRARLELFGGDEDVSASAQESIEVKGPAKPYVPINVDVDHGSISYNSADIQFIITKIHYTKETYHILYGNSEGQLTMRSEPIMGNSDLTTTNEVFTVRLLYLDHGTTYYFSVLAENENTNEASLTSTKSFTTSSLALLQVKAGSFQGCSNGQVLDSAAVSEFMRITLASVVEEGCDCEFPTSNLVNGTLLCSSIDSHDLIYRAYIVSTVEVTLMLIISHIANWIREAPEVPSGVSIITFNENCSTNISSMLDPICNTTADTLETAASSGIDLLESDLIIGVVVVLAFIIFLVLTVAILSITVCVLLRRLKASAKRRIYSSINKRESGASSVNGWHGEAHVTNKCPVYTTSYNLTHHESLDMDCPPRPPIPIPPVTNTPGGIYDSIDHLAPMAKEDLRERIAMARPPLPPEGHREDILSLTSSNMYDVEENTGSSNV